MIRYLALCLLCICCTAGAKTTTYILANGMEVIVIPDNRSTRVMCQLWYKVGSSYERAGKTGLSHFLEHMMFRGSKKYPNGAVSAEYAKIGAHYNAFTSNDVTVYYAELSAKDLPTFFAIESDRMNNLKLLAGKVAKEKTVIQEERRLRVDDIPYALATEQFALAAFAGGMYQNPVIGWMQDIENTNQEDLINWYNSYYAPNNAVMVIVGNVEPKTVLSLIKKYFSSIKKRKIPHNIPQVMTNNFGAQRKNIVIPKARPRVYIGYNIPRILDTLDEKDAYALYAAAGILDLSSSSRFEKNLIRSNLASTAGVFYFPITLHASLFELEATPVNEQNLIDLEKHLLGQVKLLQQEPVTQEELDRVKNMLVANYIYERDSMQNQAMKIGIARASGYAHAVVDKFISGIKGVSVDDIQKVATKYLIPKVQTIAHLTPNSGGQDGQ